jgi:HEAT repeat protein
MRIRAAAGISVLAALAIAFGGSPGTPKKEDVPKYLRMLTNSSSVKDRALAAEMLGRRGAIKASDVADAMEPLKGALRYDKELSVRKAAAEALGNIGVDAQNVVPLLTDALKDKNKDLKLASITALAQFGGEAKDALPALRELAKETTDKMLSKTARSAIKAISGKKK